MKAISILHKPQYSIILCLLIFCFSITLHATTYYVSNQGSDDSAGTNPEVAWKTITEINDHTYLPGDSILFQRSNTWRNNPLHMPSSGEKSNPIYFGAFGTGNLGSIQAPNWSNVLGNIWASSTTVPSDPWTIGYDGSEIFFEENNGSVSWRMHQSIVDGLTHLTMQRKKIFLSLTLKTKKL